MRTLLSIACGLAIYATCAPLAAQPGVKPLEVDDVAGLASLSGPAISPDGRWVAYAKTDVNRLRPTEQYDRVNFTGATVWVSNVQTGEAINVGGDIGASRSPAWSPNGQFLAFYADRDGAVRLWIWDLAARKTRRLSDAIIANDFWSEAATWTADSLQVIAKFAHEGEGDAVKPAPPRQLAPTGQADELPAPAAIAKPSESPSGATVTVLRSARRVESPVTPAGSFPASPTTPASPAPPVFDAVPWTHVDLGIVDVASGTARRLVRKAHIRGYRVSSDSAWVAYFSNPAVQRHTQQLVYDLSVVPLAGGTPRVLATRAPVDFGYAVAWSPDGQWIGYITGGQLARGDAFVVSIARGGPRRLTEGEHPGFGPSRSLLWAPAGDALLLLSDGRLWRAAVDGTTAVPVTSETMEHEIDALVRGPSNDAAWSPDGGRSVVVTMRHPRSRRAGLARVELATGRVTPMMEANKRYGTLVVARNGETLLYSAQDAQRPLDLWVTDRTFAHHRQVTHANPRIEQYVLGTGRVVDYQSNQGQALQAALLLPAGYQPGKRYPLVVYVYGGFHEADRVNTFGLGMAPNAQFLATRGYAVLFPSAPQGVGTPMRDLADGILPAINEVVSLGIADPDRIGIMGHSYGGYATLSLIVQSTRFKAAIAYASLADLVSSYVTLRPNDEGGARGGGIGWAEGGQGSLGGTPWECRDRFIDNSPLYFLDRVQTPVLLLQGEEDGVSPNARQSDAVFVALRRLGKEVEYRRYAREGHSVRRPENVRDLWAAVARWFDTYLRADTTGR